MKTVITIEDGKVRVEVDGVQFVQPPLPKQPLIKERICKRPECGKSFKPKAGRQVFCSFNCRGLYMQEYRKDYMKKWRPKKEEQIIISEIVPNKKPEHIEPLEDAFNDPWNCGACQLLSAICALHTKMETSGQRPPRW